MFWIYNNCGVVSPAGGRQFLI